VSPTTIATISTSFQDDDFRLGLETVLGSCYRQAADIDEVLATVRRIADGDSDSWLHEWSRTAGSVWRAGVEAERAGCRVTALAHHRRAATYYAAALHRVLHSSEPERQLGLWRRQHACWERVVDLAAGERIVIPYEGSTLPGFFFPAPGAAGERRPVVVINNGSHEATSQMWAHTGAAASERGYHWMTFNGPGQQAALYKQGVMSRPDWEAVLTPVLEALLRRPDVDPQRVCVIGVGQGGYWVARALCFEHRFAAAVLDPGVVDVSSAWTDLLPGPMRTQLESRARGGFDRAIHLAELFSPALSARLRALAQPHGPENQSRYELFRTISRYRLGDEVARITTPLLITEPMDGRFWPGQSRQLHARLPGPKTLITFTSEHRGASHGEPPAAARRETGILDWLARQLSHVGRPPQRSPTPAAISDRSTHAADREAQ
jgi:hypothetical protein